MMHIITNKRGILKILGAILIVIGIAELIPSIYSFVIREQSELYAFVPCCLGTLLVGVILFRFVKVDRLKFTPREGYIIVTASWLIACIAGAFPYYVSGYTSDLIDAFFESVSAVTTTGCTAFAGEYTSKSLLLWKAIMDWIGGMGILVFLISILPSLGINGQVIARAETPGPVFEKTSVRLSDSAKSLYLTYLIFTIAEFFLLFLSGKMSVYDNIITTLGSISTGGVLVHLEGIAYYNSFYVEFIISIFCILSSVNFAIYYYLSNRHFDKVYKNTELRAFITIIISAIIICTIGLYVTTSSSITTSLRDSFFQVISFSTTSGYTRSPYKNWPAVCQMLLLFLMLIGGCSASTSGSLKVMRVLVAIKMIFRGTVRKAHPRSVVAVIVGKKAVPAPVVSGLTVFIFTYLLTLLGSTIIVSLQGFDFETAFSTCLAMLSNTGAAFGHAAAIGNFSFYHPALKLFLSLLMITGRLELFPIIILFTRNMWGRNH